jgi:hypothetical protein
MAYDVMSPPVSVVPVTFDPGFHLVVEVLVECGWPRPAAFEIAVFLKLCRVPAHHTMEVLMACKRWRQ